MAIAKLAVVLAVGCAVSAPLPGLGQVVVREAMPLRDASPPATGTAVIKGRVVDGATGAPVARARVRVQGRGISKDPVLTDASGAFRFSGLPAGAIMIVGEKSTYMPGRYPEPGRSVRSRAMGSILRDGEVREVVVRMYRGGVITGHVIDAHGDPVEFAGVQAFRVGASGRATLSGPRSGGNTNDVGEYRLPRLEPGAYLILANAVVLFGTSEAADVRTPLPQSLPSFYPSSPSFDGAQPVELERGQTAAGIDIVLGEGIPAIVTGTVTTADGRPVTGGAVSARARIEGMGMAAFLGGGAGLRSDGTFRLPLTPGSYLLEARAASSPDASGRMREEQYGATRLTIGEGAFEQVSIVVGRGATASGRVVFEGAAALPPVPRGQVRVPLMSAEGWECRSGVVKIGPDWAFTVDGLIGTCTAPPNQMFGGFTLKAVVVDGEDIADRDVTFESGQAFRDVQVVVTRERTELELHVADDTGQATSEYVALAFPVDRSRWRSAERYLRMHVPPSPSVRPPGDIPAPPNPPRREVIAPLMPGDYYVIALDDIDAEDTRDPAMLEQLSSSAMRVTVGAGRNDVTLRRLRQEDVIRK